MASIVRLMHGNHVGSSSSRAARLAWYALTDNRKYACDSHLQEASMLQLLLTRALYMPAAGRLVCTALIPVLFTH
jgi:hypothetical protein